MRLDELTRELRDARDDQPTADVATGRDAVARAVRRHQNRRVAAIAVCVVLLLGTFAVTMSRAGTSDPGYGANTEGIPKLIPTGLPDGLRIKLLTTGAGDLSPFPVDDVHVSVFAKPGAQAPNDGFVITKARVGSVRSPGSTPPTTQVIDPADVQTDADGVRVAGRAEADGTTTIALATTVEPAELTAILRGVRYLPSGEVDPASVPPAYERVVSNAQTFWLVNTMFSTLGTAGYVQIYAAPSTSPTTGAASNPLGSTSETSLSISAQVAGRNDVEAARWMIPNAEARTVRGHPAVGGSFTMTSTTSAGGGSVSGSSRETTPGTEVRRTVIGAYRVLAWMENDSTLVQLTSANYSLDELARIAEGLQVDRSDFRDLRAATTTTTLAENCQRTADGGTVCRTVTGSGGSGGGSAGSCTTIDPPSTGTVTDQRRATASASCQATPIDPNVGPTTTALSPTAPIPTTATTATP